VPQPADLSPEEPKSNERHNLWRTVWAVYGTAFVICGLVGLVELRNRVPISSAGPLSSTDTVFLETLGVENAGARIADCLKDVPESEPVALVYQNVGLGELDALLIGSIAWPRRIPQIPVSAREPLENARLIEVNATRAIFFIGLPRPSSSEHMRSLSPVMHFYRSPALPRPE
jgi:hypothetical protein